MEGAINNQAADRKLYGYAHHNNEVIAACCERMITVWLFFTAHPLLLATLHACQLCTRRGKGPCRWPLWLSSLIFKSQASPFIYSLRYKEMHYDTLAPQQRVLLLAARAHANRHRYKSILKEACTLYTPAGSGIPQWQTVRLFLTMDLLSLLCKVWFHTGKYEMSPREGSRLGQGGTPYSRASYLCVTLGILSPSQLSAPSLPEAPSLGFRLSSPGLVHIQPGRMPGWSPSSLHAVYSNCWKEKIPQKMHRGPLSPRSTMWALMMAA